jgi:hypothetical protein
MAHTPEQVIRYALDEAINALDGGDWESLMGHLDVAQSWVPSAKAHAAEHEPRGVADLMVAVGDVWRDKETSHLVVVVPSVEGIATVAFGAPSDSPETHWTPHEFLRACTPVPDGERL